MTLILDQERSTRPGVGLAAGTRQATKIHTVGTTEVRALDNIDVAFTQGELSVIMGPSGSGKSTLLQCMAGLEPLTTGSAFIGDVDIDQLDEKELTALRRDHLGFIFQAFNLIPSLNVDENVRLPPRLAGRTVDEAWFDEVISLVGLGDRLEHRPGELSGGQQQRVAIARALVNRPKLIFADEPTGNLDRSGGTEILTFLRHAVAELGQTIVMVTHDPTAAGFGDRVVFLVDGQVEVDLADPTSEVVFDQMRRFGR